MISNLTIQNLELQNNYKTTTKKKTDKIIYRIYDVLRLVD
jgi:hypothetical protein